MTGRNRRSGQRPDEQLRLFAGLCGDVNDMLAVRCQRFQAAVLLEERAIVDGRRNDFVSSLAMSLQVPKML